MRRLIKASLAALALVAANQAWSEDPGVTSAPAVEQAPAAPESAGSAPAGEIAPAPAVVAPPVPAENPEAMATPTPPEVVAPATPPPMPMPGEALRLVGNFEAGKKIFNEGKGEAPPCMSCHGEQGLGDDNMGTPRLAGQGFTYIRKQLYEFAADLRTDTTMGVMNGVAKALSDQDKADIAAYESSVHHDALASASNLDEIKTAGTVPVGERHLGKGIVLYGIPAQGVPACSSCHQFNGRGALPIYPVIGGQRYVYLVNQLKKWKDGSRANDPLAQMRAVASKLKDEDIYNVAAYLTSAPPISMGNSRQPHQIPPNTAGAAHE
ncbi:MAG: c-type cytochrome [Gammaproteobacteria bacterium]|nr:c-type cytochrome [Gammaproteobacteria bacterium]